MSRPSRPGAPAPVRLRYGSHHSQFAELHQPDGSAPAPVCVVIHGGFWRASYGLELGTPLAADLARHGMAALNLEYRRVGAGGGWPHTCLDVAAAVDSLAGMPADLATRLDLRRVIALGHSAGGHLAGWLAGRSSLPPGSPGAAPLVPLTGAVLQAGVLDLESAVAAHLGTGAVRSFLNPTGKDDPTGDSGGPPVGDRAGPGGANESGEAGGTASQPAQGAQGPQGAQGGAPAYDLASPIALLPTGVSTVLVHGDRDREVPVQQSRAYARAATAAGDDCRLIVLPGADHFGVITPGSPDWAVCREAVLALARP